MDMATETLLRELRGSPTDLAKLVVSVHERHQGCVAVSAPAIARWNRDDPRSWTLVQEWLTREGVEVLVE
jgi:hypothetical protein